MFRSLDHPQGAALFFAKVILKKHSQNFFIFTGCCGSMSCCHNIL